MVTAYPVANKKKAFDICLAFVRGCGGQIGTTYRGGPSFFYGVDESNLEIWKQARASGEGFYFCDNSYFDTARQTYFRVTKNRLQHSGLGTSDGKRFAALDVPIEPWHVGGAHIVVCPQSDAFMRVIGYQGHWLTDVVDYLATHTDRKIRVRPWSANKGALAATLQDDLRGAHALITWTSAAAVTAVLSGIPVIVQGPDCAASVMSAGGQELERLITPDRETWAGVLADNQFTLDEFRDGSAWHHLNKQP